MDFLLILGWEYSTICSVFNYFFNKRKIKRFKQRLGLGWYKYLLNPFSFVYGHKKGQKRGILIQTTERKNNNGTKERKIRRKYAYVLLCIYFRLRT